MAAPEPGLRGDKQVKWEGMRRTLRHLMIAAAILGVAAAFLFLTLADVICIGNFCRS